MGQQEISLIHHPRTKKHINLESVATMKKIMDYMADRMIEVYRENITLTTKLSETDKRNAEYLQLAERVGRRSVDVAAEGPVQSAAPRRQYSEDHAVIVSALEKDQDIDESKKSIKEVCKAKPGIVAPGDVIVTKSNQVILRMKNRGEATAIQELLRETESLRDKARVAVPYRRRERVLILSVDPEIEEEKIMEDLGRTLDDLRPDAEFTRSLLNKLRDPSLTGAARTAIEDLHAENKAEFRIVRKINTRAGKVNWLIDVDRETSQRLLEKRRVCIDYERYRVVEFVTITRCFKCQEFGHMSGQCKGELRCPKCSEGHKLSDCKSSLNQCSNCYFRDKDGD